MLNSFLEMIQYDFILRALFAGLAIALCSAILGVSLVFRKNSMIGDGLSHVAFGATAIAVALGFAPLPIAIPVATIASIFILKINDNRKINSDAFIAIISASALAIGTIAASINGGTNIDLNAYLFGSILAISTGDLILSLILCAAIIILYTLYYRFILAITIDETFARSIGIKSRIFNLALAISSSLIIVIGMRMLGTLLISSFLVFPCLIATIFTKNFRQTVILSGVLSVICFIVGLTLSYTFSLPTGATIVLTNLAVFILSKIYKLLA